MIKSMNMMPSIDHFNLWSFDLNLLVAFDALMQERSVTRAAGRLKIQQPAMSHNLSTLRVLMQDELFVRVGQVMQPTPRAHELSLTVGQILSQAQQALVSRTTFDPLKEERTFRIGFSSELEVILMPELAAVLRSIAPGIRVLARPAAPEQVHRMLDDGAIDLGVGCYEAGGTRHRHRLLFEQSLMCCFNPALLPFEPPIDRRSFLSAQHVLVSQKDAIEGCIDGALKKLDVSLDVAMAAPEFLTVLASATKAPLIATLPTRIIRRYAPLFGLRESPVPLKLDVSPISVIWSAQADREPGLEWLRAQITPLVTAID